MFQDPETDTPSYSFAAFSKLFELELTASSPFLPGAETVWIDADGARRLQADSGWSYWSGRLKGSANSGIRIRTKGPAVEGLIRDGDQIYLVHPALQWESSPGVAEAVIYRLEDLGAFWGFYGCGAEEDERVMPPVPRGSDGKGSSAAPASIVSNALREVEIRLLLDSYFFDRHGPSSADQVQALIHAVNGLFEEEMGVTFRITETEVSTTSSQDVVGGTTDARLLLDELGQAEVLDGADIAHLFTARELNGNTLGISWMGATCNPLHAVSLTQDLPTAPWRFVALAHELAHVLGARHDGVGYCGRIPPGLIMWPVLNPAAVSFSECSREMVGLNLPRFACVSPLAPARVPAPEWTLASVVRPVHLRWTPVEGVQEYVVEVFDEAREETVFSETVSETDIMPNVEFRAGASYRWRVAGVTPAGMGDRSPWKRFTVSTWVTR